MASLSLPQPHLYNQSSWFGGLQTHDGTLPLTPSGTLGGKHALAGVTAVRGLIQVILTFTSQQSCGYYGVHLVMVPAGPWAFIRTGSYYDSAEDGRARPDRRGHNLDFKGAAD